MYTYIYVNLSLCPSASLSIYLICNSEGVCLCLCFYIIIHVYSCDGFMKKRICDDDRNIGVTCGQKDPTTDWRNEEYTFEIDFPSHLNEEIIG